MTGDTIRVRVARSQFRYDGTRYRRGDTLEVQQRTLERHPNTLKRIEVDVVQDDDTAEDADGESDDGVTVDDLDPHPEDLKVGELEERIADVDDVELLETIREAETKTKDRTTAVDAIDARLNELED